jgi:nucleoside-diphosphate-sugar epimerase
MHVVVVGGTGHIGSYLVPRLIAAGHQVTCLSRGLRSPYHEHAAWQEVRRVQIDRAAAERGGEFGRQVRALKPDAVMDLTCFTPESAAQIVEALRGEIQLFAHCGTVWVHGYPTQAPMTEAQPRHPIGEYGIRKSQIETYLLDQARRHGFPATVLHPGHIVGPGWAPVGPTACHDIQAFARLARGEELALPNLGLETVHHVHADDVAQAFENTLTHWRAALGESFLIVSPAALTLRGYAEAVAAWFGREANLRFLPLEEWKASLPPDFVEGGISHLVHCTNASPAKAMRLLGYAPRYTSLQAVREALDWLIASGGLKLT